MNAANVINKTIVSAVVLFWAFVAECSCAQGFLEIPGPNSTQTGISVISGWHCTANRIEIVIDGGAPLLAGSHTSREDTLGVCGRAAQDSRCFSTGTCSRFAGTVVHTVSLH